MAVFINRRRLPFAVLVLVTFIITMLAPVQAWAALMRATPDAVVEQDDFSEEFVLKLEDDLLINTELADYISLGGDFEDLSVSEVVYRDCTTVTAKVYGALKHSTGTGTITLLGEALEGGEDVTVDVTVGRMEFAGSGTEEDPYQINTPEQLDLIRNDLEAHYILMADIDLEDYLSEEGEGYNGGKGWVPIGSEDNPFTGRLDGNGYVIRNLEINRSDEDLVGLFGHVEEDGYLRDVGLENANVIGLDLVGGLVGVNFGTIENCYAGSVDVSGGESVGGLVCGNGGNMCNCYATGVVSGSFSVGGLVGSNLGLVEGCYSSESVGGEECVGGLVGFNFGEIRNCYATGAASGSKSVSEYASVGGLVGINADIVENCYSTATVEGGENAGGLVGLNEEMFEGVVYNSYYDCQSTGQSDTGKGEPKATVEMQLRSTYEDWDFLYVWSIEDGRCYPMLRWQEEAPQSGFEVEAENSRVEPEVAFHLIITDAMDEDGERLEGSHEVTVYSEIEEKNVFQAYAEFTNGGTVVPVTLNTVGKHDLRISVAGISYSNLVNIDLITDFAGGSGTEEDPYEIETAELLALIHSDLEAHYILMADIDLEDYLSEEGEGYNDGKGWVPIGSEDNPFTGSLDGNGYVIRNLYINRPEEDYIGLFGRTENAVLCNLQLEDVNVTGKRNAGGLVGAVRGGTVESCKVDGSVNGNMRVGGLAGFNLGGKITESTAGVKVVASKGSFTVSIYTGGLIGDNQGVISDSQATGDVSGELYVGGLVGVNTNGIFNNEISFGKITGSSASGKVTGETSIGGLLGINDGAIVENSYATGQVEGIEDVGGLAGEISCGPVNNSFAQGSVTGEINVGGLAGLCFNGTISACYAAGEVTGIDNSSSIGGLVGSVEEYSTIKHCFAAGLVTGDFKVGGLVGHNEESEIINCYYDSQTTGLSKDDNEWGEPKTTAEMMQKDTFEDWDFDNTWAIAEGHTYPYLKWQDNYGFTVAFAQSGDKRAGRAFEVNIINATDVFGKPLNGVKNVTVTSNLEDGEVYSGLLIFIDGEAAVSITLHRSGKHKLSVSVAGVPGQEVLAVTVVAGESGKSTRREIPKAQLVISEDSVTVSIPAKLDSTAGIASGEVDGASLKEAFDKSKLNQQGIKMVEIDMPEINGAKAYEIALPAGVLAGGETARAVKINTGIGAITVPGNMLSETGLADAETFSLKIATADKSMLDSDLRLKIGDRPVIELGLKINGKSVSWSNEDAPVKVSIPYIPTEQELADPEHITVWYIDGEGNVVEVPSGRYDPSTSTVTFSVTHFSKYAVVYITKTFDDIDSVPWAKKPIEVLASKGILKGRTETEYAPQIAITRAEFLYSLVRTLGVTAGYDDNFDDIKSDAYYYEEIGIAKKLGITNGTGHNKFSPDASITRQDMMVLAERALRMLKRLEIRGIDSDLDKFEDKHLIADYAVDSTAALVKEGLIVGSENEVNPLGNTTRAEAAVFLYRIYNLN